MRWITVTHTQRWHANRHSSATGPVYQGRFRSFPVQGDEHFLTVARYVERNALRGGLVRRAEQWRWSSLWRWGQRGYPANGIFKRLACGAATAVGGVGEPIGTKY
jgi:putative transposase